LLIEPNRHATWDDLIVANLESSIRQLKATTKVKSLKNLNWGKFNQSRDFSIRWPSRIVPSRGSF
jgi:hypothetical protein